MQANVTNPPAQACVDVENTRQSNTWDVFLCKSTLYTQIVKFLKKAKKQLGSHYERLADVKFEC